MLPDILEMLLDILNRISGKVCSANPWQTKQLEKSFAICQ
jgi:hypothetical protein